MTETKLDRGVIFVLRILMGWTFLYAGAWQIWDNFDTAGFLNHVVTFHAVFAVFATAMLLPITDIPGEVRSSIDRPVSRSPALWCASAARSVSC